jgi:hypothetical protein
MKTSRKVAVALISLGLAMLGTGSIPSLAAQKHYVHHHSSTHHPTAQRHARNPYHPGYIHGQE